jgi:hypothetical protein
VFLKFKKRRGADRALVHQGEEAMRKLEVYKKVVKELWMKPTGVEKANV